MTEKLIETHNLCKDFGLNKAVVDLNITLNKGVTIGLVGPNGAGKTTLFSLLCGFLKPSKGTVKVLGLSPDASELRSRIAILPQDAALLKAIPVGKQLAMFAELQGFSKPEARAEAIRVLKLVRLEDSRNQLAERLSHGMLKRIAIAQTFIGSPEVVLLDEPTAGLDPNTSDGIKSVIRELSKQTSFIISSHNLEVIEDLCQEIIILQKGKLHSHAQVADLTARTKALSFRLEHDPDAAIQSVLMELPMVTDVNLGKPGQHRMVVHFTETSDQPAEIQILTALAQAGINYREMVRGERLQESVANSLD